LKNLTCRAATMGKLLLVKTGDAGALLSPRHCLLIDVALLADTLRHAHPSLFASAD
jgi:hypothetical protein